MPDRPHTSPAPGSRCLCQLLDLGFPKLFLEMDEDGVLVSCNHDVDEVRVNHPEANISPYTPGWKGLLTGLGKHATIKRRIHYTKQRTDRT